MRKDCTVTTAQVAATVAGLLGVEEEFRKAAPRAAEMLAGVVAEDGPRRREGEEKDAKKKED